MQALVVLNLLSCFHVT